MRRQMMLVLFILLASVALVSAQIQESRPGSAAAMPAPPIATLRTDDGRVHTLVLEPIEEPDGPLATTAAPAKDACANAPTLLISDGGSTPDIRFFNAIVDGSDPVLSCMWGDPADQRGFRTAWYAFRPDAYGVVSLSTRTSNYDTVLAVHRGACDALIELACNDDSNYFTSRVELQVQGGETYYVEVADWHSAASGNMTLNLVSEPAPINSQWEVTSAGSATDSFRSRHAVVADGAKLYVIAGLTSVGAGSDRTPTMYAYDTTTGHTEALPQMPGGSDGKGYANTTAALVEGHIYMPAGYTGINDGTHWVYDIAEEIWDEDTVTDNDWPGGIPAIFSQASEYSFSGPPGNGYFLTGGMTGLFPVNDGSANWSPRPETYFYSVNTNSWTQLNSMPVGRFGHVAAMQFINSQDHLCVAGGMGGVPETNREALDSTSCYDTDSGNWSDFADLNFERYFASSAVDAAGNWYVFGGYDNLDIPVDVTERYDADNDEWVVLSPAFNVVPARAWSRGAYVGNTLWIIGGEIVNQNILDMVQKAVLFRGSILNYLPILNQAREDGQRNDTMANARAVGFPSGTLDRFFAPFDMVNIYSFDVPAPRQPVRILLDHYYSSDHLDLVLYDDNKVFQAASREPGSSREVITRNLSPGRYYVAVERVFPLVGDNPSTGEYILQVAPG